MPFGPLVAAYAELVALRCRDAQPGKRLGSHETSHAMDKRLLAA